MKMQVERTFYNQTINQCKYGVIGMICAFLALLTWSYFAPLSSAVIASGTLKNDGHRHVIQHPESAITEKVLVNDGDTVSAGDVLLVLNTQELEAAQRSLKIEYLQIKLEKNRHYANMNEINTLQIPSDLLALSESIGQQHRAALEVTLWQENQRKLRRQVQIFNIQQHAIDENIYKEETLYEYWKHQVSLLRHDQQALSELSQKLMVSKSQKLKIDHAMIELKKNLEISRFTIDQHKRNRQDIPQKIEDLIAENRQISLERYQQLDSREPEIVRKLAIVQQKIERSVIFSPIDGRVNGLTVNAAGGTILANTPLLEIIPNSGKLVVEARLSPRDIDSLNGHEEARVRLTALNPRHHRPLTARIQSISADTVYDAAGEPFYRMQLAIESPSDSIPRLYPGMSTEVFITTGNFTTFDFLIGRLINTSEHGLRETL
jgi:membrane fusion protein, type I secretion system